MSDQGSPNENWTTVSTLSGIELSDTAGHQWAINDKGKYVAATDVDSKKDNYKLRVTLSIPSASVENAKAYAGDWTVKIVSPARVRLNSENVYTAGNRKALGGTYELISATSLTIDANGAITAGATTIFYVSVDGDPSGANATPIAGDPKADDDTETGKSVTGNLVVSVE